MKTILTAAAIAATATLASAGDVFFQGFETDTAGVIAGSPYGTITRVASGTNVTSAGGSFHAVVTEAGGSSAFTRFDGYRDTWTGGYTASVDVYLDTTWATGEGFSYSVASNNSSGSHLRDFIFHVVQDASAGGLIVAANNNSNSVVSQGYDIDPNQSFAMISTSGWYTLEHTFREAADGSLAVDLNLIDAFGDIVYTETRNAPGDLIATLVGGNRYGWFTTVDVATGINIDNLRLAVVPLPPAAWAGLAMLGGIVGVRKLRRR